MVDAVYRGNIEELLSVSNHLKKYIIAFVVIVLLLLSVVHFKYSAPIVPLVTVSLVLLPAAYYTAVLVLKFGSSFVPSSRSLGDIAAMNENGDHRHHHQGLKTPDAPYPKSPTPPPSYEEATRNDHVLLPVRQPRPWLPSTSSGHCGGGSAWSPAAVPPSQTVFDVERQYNAVVADRNRLVEAAAATPPQQQQQQQPQPPTATRTATVVQNIPSVTITVDNDDRRSMEI